MPKDSGRLVFLVLPLYVAFGCSAGLLQVAVPSMLQAQGMSIERAGMLALLYLPFGLSVLWAPFIDRYRLSAWGRRKSWVLLCQSIVVAALLVAALVGPGQVAILIAAMAVLSVSAATLDVALDGYLAETSSMRDRVGRGGIKVIGMLSGTLIGSILVLAMMERVGWTWTIAAVATSAALAAVPFLLHQEETSGNETRGFPSVRRFLSTPRVAGRVLLVVLTGLALGMGLGAPRLLMVERGFPLTVVGAIFGPVGALAGLTGAIAGTAIGRRFGLRAALLAAAGLFFLATCGLGVIFAERSGSVILVASIIATAVLSYGALYGAVCALAIGWVSAGQAATDYSIVQSGWNLSLVAGTALGGFGLSLLTSSVFPAAGLVVLVVAALLLRAENASAEAPAPDPGALKA